MAGAFLKQEDGELKSSLGNLGKRCLKVKS